MDIDFENLQVADVYVYKYEPVSDI